MELLHWVFYSGVCLYVMVWCVIMMFDLIDIATVQTVSVVCTVDTHSSLLAPLPPRVQPLTAVMVGLTQEQRAEVVRLHMQNESISGIARVTGHNRRDIRKWTRRFDECASLHDMPRSGRPSKITPLLRSKVRKLVQREQATSARAAAATLQAQGMEVGRETVRRALHAEGLRPYTPQHKPMQQHGDKKRRLDFASTNKDRNWNKVFFGDEKRFSLYTLPNKKTGIRWSDAASHVEPVSTPAHPASINIYGAFSARGPTPLNLFSGVMTAASYINILQTTLLPAASEAFPRGGWTYLQDSDPKHTAAATQQWLGANVPHYITRHEWPARSPDLNPIENAWPLVAARVRRAQPHNLDSLKRAIRSAWAEVMTVDYCHTLADSMPTRFAELRRARGGHTHY